MIHRINAFGLQYYLFDEGEKTKITSRGKSITVNMTIDEMSSCWYQWQMQSKFIQDAFPKLTAEEREFLMTGITPDEWNRTFNDTGE